MEIRRCGETRWTPVAVATGTPAEAMARKRFEALRATIAAPGSSLDAVRLRQGDTIVDQVLAARPASTS